MPVHAYLVVGSTGAGKSTYARGLAERLGAVPFAIDAWMVQLFGDDRPADAGYDWYAPRIERCVAQILSVVASLAAVGTPSVLEIGMTRRADRAAFFAAAQALGVAVALHAVEAPVDVRWARVEQRNAEQGATFSLHVTRPMFDFVEGMWEAPDDAEVAARQGIRVHTG